MSGYPCRQPKPCVDCGRKVRGGRLRCRPCRMTDRQCTKCGRTFRSDRPLCGTCQRTKRTCTTCGKEFLGTSYKCRGCALQGKPPRVCAKCGTQYNDAWSRSCWQCRQVIAEKSCIDCGTPFTGTAKRCNPCRASEHVCECGKIFKSRSHTRCSTCRQTERSCVECGRMIRKLGRTCNVCLGKRERSCIDCGKTYQGLKRQCNQCGWLARPYEERNSRGLAAVNKRRAIKKAAEVFGPVPAEVYAALRAEPECVYCGEPPTQIDHVRPLDKGGWEHESNLVPACGPCNHSKGPRLLTEWDQDKVLRGAAFSDKVAAEYGRLLALELQEAAS